MKGGSTGFAPIQVRIVITIKIVHKINLLIGRNILEDEDGEDKNGIMYRIAIENIKAITPPSLLGTERRIA